MIEIGSLKFKNIYSAFHSENVPMIMIMMMTRMITFLQVIGDVFVLRDGTETTARRGWRPTVLMALIMMEVLFLLFSLLFSLLFLFLLSFSVVVVVVV